MKKILFLAAIGAMTAIATTSCNGDSKADLKDTADSIAYDLGVWQAPSLKQHITMNLGVDSAYIDQFIKGMKEGAYNEADPKKAAYMKGLEIGQQIQQMGKNLSADVYAGDSTKSINVKCIVAGFVAGLKGSETMTADEAYADFNAKLEPLREANLEKQFGDNKKAGEDYLAANAKKEGVTTTKSGLQYKVLVPGDGALPTDTSTVQINYEGKLIDGTVFDSSYQRNQPLTVNMAHPNVIAGWVEAVKMMPAGSKWEVTIPQNLAYGSRNMGQIQPFSTLIFTIEILK